MPRTFPPPGPVTAAAAGNARRRLLLLVALAVPAGCAGPPADDPEAVPAQGPWVPAAEALTTLIEHELRDKGIPALSIALVDGDRTVWARGFGSADAPGGTAATAGTVYRVGPVSSLFTAIGVMQLVERGILDLDAPVRTWLPDFRPANPFGGEITLRHLLSHRAGLASEPPAGSRFDPAGATLEDAVRSLNGTTLREPPGTRTRHSSAGAAVAGRVVEAVQGRPFAAHLDEAVLRPMGLRGSAFVPDARLRSRLARATLWTYDEREFPAPALGTATGPADGLYATVHDLARFARVLFDRGRAEGGPVLRPGTLEAMWEPQFAGPGATSGFGLGFHVTRDDSTFAVVHGGGAFGFATHFLALPDERLAVVVATTKGATDAVAARIAATALAHLRAVRRGSPAPPVVTTSPVPDSLAGALAGRWAGRDTHYDLSRDGAKLNAWRRDGEVRMTLKRLRGDTLIVDDELAFGPVVRPLGTRLVFGDDTLTRAPHPSLPPEPPAAWRGLLGEYGPDHGPLIVLEREGRLNVLVEWLAMYPLAPVDDTTFRFPDRGPYPGEAVVFHRDPAGRATAVVAAGIRFARRAVGAEEGVTFRVRPTRPVEELRREALAASPPEETGDFRESELVELVRVDPTLRLDIRYADTNNFLGTPFYDEARAFLQRPAAEAVARAHAVLRGAGYGLLIHDGYRPWYVTKMFWDGTAEEHHDFVADPSRGSRHNRGCAVDLTLFDRRTGRAVTMPGGYDEFSPRSYPNYPGGTSRQRWLRDLLRRAMEAEGFTVYRTEWWHFDHRDWPRYRLGNQTFDRIGR
jgi:CubicO group peptidase (beta-lactamase class C family)/D-alanyl-D-alanine dipeptidase